MNPIARINALSKNRDCDSKPNRALAFAVMLVTTGLFPTLASANATKEALSRSPVTVDAAPSVHYENGRLSLQATQSSWKDVLDAIQARTGIRFHHARPFQGSVSASFSSLSVGQALARLFGPEAGFILRHPPNGWGSPSTPKEVWILGQLKGSASAWHGTHAPAHGAIPIPEEQPSTVESEGDASGSMLDENDVIQHYTKMAEHDDPAMRAEAVSALGQSGKRDEPEVRNTLDAALSDKDPSVRSAAHQALASRGGPEAMGQLWQALEDPDPGVRIVAVDSVAPGKEGEALLEKALSDADETVRGIAAERLKQVPN
ncbi:MAG: HEAT repeat domain-containing protein [Chromatiales bacterium]